MVVFNWKSNYKVLFFVRFLGVFDFMEFFMISGIFCGEGLFVMDEEIFSGLCYFMEFVDILVIENDFIKEFLNEVLDKYSSDWLLLKFNLLVFNDVILIFMVSFFVFYS